MCVTRAVALEGGAGGVEGVAVDLDDEVVLWPQEVDFVAADSRVRLWGRRWAARMSSRRRRSASDLVNAGSVWIAFPVPGFLDAAQRDT